MLFERHPQIEFEAPPPFHAIVHRLFEELVAAPAAGLRTIQGNLGVPEQAIGIKTFVGRKGDADAGVDDEMMTAEFVGNSDRLLDTHRQRGRLRRIVYSDLHDAEFIAAQTGDRSGIADALLQPRRHRLQKIVADGMAERVVDGFEMVEIKHQHGKPPAPPDPSQRLLKALTKLGPVRQVGQGIMSGEVGDAGLGLPALADIVMRDDPAASRNRSFDHVHGAAIGRIEADVRHRSAADPLQDACAQTLGVPRKRTPLGAVPDYLGQGTAGFDDLGREAVHLDVALIANDDPRRLVEHQQSLAHVVESQVQILDAFIQIASDVLHVIQSWNDETLVDRKPIAYT